MNVLVTGAKGFVGKNLVASLENIRDNKDRTHPGLKIEKIFSLTKEQADKINENAWKIIDQYSMDKFYSNILEVYKRALRKWW